MEAKEEEPEEEEEQEAAAAVQRCSMCVESVGDFSIIRGRPVVSIQKSG